jgi:arsenite-transporting ATPase
MSPLAELAGTLPRFAFFTGKGGVGKTSTACAIAVHLADDGKRVLLVSTDPASNLGDVFGTPIGEHPGPVGVPRLDVMNVNPEASAQAYRDRVIGPMRGVLPDDAIRQMEEQLSGACTTEVAAFDEFAALLVDESRIAPYDHILFDTAPTGHTLRLLQLPAAWSGFLDENARGSSCLGPLSGQQEKRERYAETTTVLRDPDQTLLVLVARAEVGALAEADRTWHELGALGLARAHLVVNAVFTATDRHDPLAVALTMRGEAALRGMPATLAALPRTTVGLQPFNIVGLEALRAVTGGGVTPAAHHPPEMPSVALPGLVAAVEDLRARDHGLVMVMGKGGVGKTTIAAAIAVALADAGREVHLTTTDPAAHLLETVAEDIPHLTISRIDPVAETETYRTKVLARAGANLDADGRALLEEDLRSPCTEEVAVFHAFSRVVNEARRGLVIVDTAPTGHTLLLLDAAGSYHREILRNTGIAPDRVVTPLMRLQDPSHTSILIVTLPEPTPVAEATALQADLARAGITPLGWVVNQSLAAARVTDPVLRARAQAEVAMLEAARTASGGRCMVVPMQPDAPIGAAALRALV